MNLNCWVFGILRFKYFRRYICCLHFRLAFLWLKRKEIDVTQESRIRGLLCLLCVFSNTLKSYKTYLCQKNLIAWLSSFVKNDYVRCSCTESINNCMPLWLRKARVKMDCNLKVWNFSTSSHNVFENQWKMAVVRSVFTDSLHIVLFCASQRLRHE